MDGANGKQQTIKFVGNKIEFAKWFVAVWFTITIALLSFAVSWGFNLATIGQVKTLTEKHEIILHGIGGYGGVAGDMKMIKTDVTWIKKALNEIKMQIANDKNIQIKEKS